MICMPTAHIPEIHGVTAVLCSMSGCRIREGDDVRVFTYVLVSENECLESSRPIWRYSAT